MRTWSAQIAVFLAFQTICFGDVSKEQANRDLQALVEKRQFDEVEK